MNTSLLNIDALHELESRLVTVEARLQARDGMTEQMQTLRPYVDRKLDELARTIALFREGKRDAAVVLVRTHEGQRTMDAIRAFVGQRVLLEQRNVEHLIAVERAALDSTVRSSITVSGLAIALDKAMGRAP